MRRGWFSIALLMSALALQSCALPPIVAVASYSADIVSYAATGKTVTDHAYSAVARSDCSFVRVLKKKPICTDETVQPVQVAAAAQAAPAATANPVATAARDRYVAIGSFLDGANADRSVARYAAFHPVIEAVEVHGQHFHRVVAGPLSADEVAALRAEMVAAALSSAQRG
jgi:cell division protein FtsN